MNLKAEFNQLFAKYTELEIVQGDADLIDIKSLVVYETNQIEGLTLTFAETKAFIENNVTKGEKDFKNYLQAKGLAKAYDYVLHVYANRYPFDERVLKKINELVLSSLFNEDYYPKSKAEGQVLGEYKLHPNKIKYSSTKHGNGEIQDVKPAEVATEVEKALQEYHRNSQKDVVESLAKLHLDIYRIQPFIDGNRRTSLLVIGLEMLRHKYPLMPLNINERATAENYTQALIDGVLENNPSYLADFMYQNYNRYLSSKIEEEGSRKK